MYIVVPEIRAQSSNAVPVTTIRTIDRASVRLASALNVFELNHGRVIVNDGIARQVVILDSTLSRVTVLLDSAAGGPQSYGPIAAPMVAYGRDSLLFVDGASRSMLVLDREGQKRGVIAGPGGSDFRFLAGGYWGVDSKGNLLYRVMEMRMTSTPPGARGPGTQQVQAFPDSATLVRFDVEARRVDTLVRIKQEAGTRGVATIDAAGKRSLR